MADDVALVCMPFGPLFSPCLGLSLLRAELAEHHVAARVHYFSIQFAESIGQAFYMRIAKHGPPAMEDFAGEWLFNRALFDTTPAEDARYVSDMLEGYYSEALIARLLRARERVDGFLDDSLDILLRQGASIVGFTSTFQQHVASLALARRLKQASPSTFVILGGSNCEDVMGAETVRSFPFVDAAFSGEADLVFPALVRRVMNGESVAGLPGVRSREHIEQEFAAGAFSNGPVVREMDRLPVPKYDDYFEQFKASRYDRDWQPSVFVETSRGCWWGERAHCTFCGLNGSTITFRSKSPARALAEVTELARRHPGCDVEAVDNVLDPKYLDEVVPALAARRRKVSLFYETRSDLKKDQLRRLRSAGISIQVGIESFSTPVLKLMRKGVTGLQNIQYLKWCKELGIQATWNFLWGFPGEPPEEYERLAGLIPLLTHLPPPATNDQIRLDRFSPNFIDAERLGFTDVKPIPSYKYVYHLPDAAVANLACYFTFEYAEPRDVDRYTRRLAREVETWKRTARASDLVCVEAGEHVVIIDMRPASRTSFTVLSGRARLLYRECDAIRDVAQLARAAAVWNGASPSVDAIEQTLAPLVERGLLVREGSRYLALAIPLGEYAPPASTKRQFAALVRKLGVRDGERWIVPVDNVASRARAQRTGTRHGKVPQLDAARFSIASNGELVIERSADQNPHERRSHGEEETRQAGSGPGQGEGEGQGEGQRQEVTAV